MKDTLLKAVAASCFLLLSAVAQAEIHRDTHEHTFSADKFNAFSVLNLAGKVELKKAPGEDIVVRATFNGEGRDAAEAKRNAALLSLDIRETGNRVEIVTVYPVKDHGEFIYDAGNPGANGGFLSSVFGSGSRSTVRYMNERVTVRGGGRGLAVHADYEVLVPAGVAVTFDNKVGNVRAENIEGVLKLDTASGSILVEGGKGDVEADTGSGSVRVSDRTGNVKADTGSGSVALKAIRGDVDADTGSGSVSINDVVGSVRADTGSGSVTMEDITGNVLADTGSGSVRGRNLQQVKELEVDTGSGSVQLEGDFSGLERMKIDTGSGSVRIRTSGTLNMQLRVSTGSGGVNVDLPETQMKNVRSGRGRFEATLGDGKGRGVIDTGSGGVRISTL